MKRFLKAFGSFFSSINFIRTHQLRKYIILPALLSLILGVGLGFLIYTGVYQLLLSAVESLVSFFSSAPPEGFDELPTPLAFVFNLIAIGFSLVLFTVFYTPISSLILPPFLGPLLKKVELILDKTPPESTFSQDLKTSITSVPTALKLLITGLFAFVVTLPLGPFQILVMGPIQGYFLGYEIFTYILERDSSANTAKLAKGFRPEILGVGCAYFLLLFVPIVGVILGPVAALTGATITYHSK